MLALGGTVRVAPYAHLRHPRARRAHPRRARRDARRRSWPITARSPYGADAAAAFETALLLEWACARLLARGQPRRPARARRRAAPGGRGRGRRSAATAPPAGPRGRDEVVALGVHVVDVLVASRLPRSRRARAGRWSSEIRDHRRPGRPAGRRSRSPSSAPTVTVRRGDRDRRARRRAASRCSARYGSRHLAAGRRDGVQTSASVLPIRPDGSRPAFHVIGANATYSRPMRPWDDDRRRRLTCTSALRSSWAARRPRRSSPSRASTASSPPPTCSLPATRRPRSSTGSRPRFDHLDYLLPNDEQVLGADRRGRRWRPAAARCWSAASAAWPPPRGADGALVVDDDGALARVPAFAVEVVDTTGCGDAFSAGFLRGLSLGRSRREAARLGCAAAALVASGLGSDHGRLRPVRSRRAARREHPDPDQEPIASA